MGKAALMIIVASMVVGSMQAVGTKEAVWQAERRLSEHQYQILARNAALAGYSVAKQALADNFESNTFGGTYDGSEYEVTVVVSNSVAELVSTGIARNGFNQTFPFEIFAAIEQTQGGVPESVPPFMDYALLTDGNHYLKGAIKAHVYPAAGAVNANFHTNGNLEVYGNTAHVEGFGYHSGNATSNPASALEKTFQPNHNPDDLPSVEKASIVDIPAFDSQEYLNRVRVDQTTASDLTLSGIINPGGTREDPYIWHVTGNVKATGGTVVSGYVMFIVEGNIDLSGDVEIGESGYSEADESSVGLYTKGNVEFSGNAQVFGQIYANGNLIFRGTPDIYGTATAKGNAEISGTPTFHYRPASPALTTIWEDAATKLELVAYSEW